MFHNALDFIPPPCKSQPKEVCEGEVSQVLPSCCCQTVQPALLHIDLTLYSALCNNSVQTHLITDIYYTYLKYVYKNDYYVNMYIRRFDSIFFPFDYIVYFAIALFL